MITADHGRSALCGRAVFPDGIRDNWLLGIENGIIVLSCEKDSSGARAFLDALAPDKIVCYNDHILAPGLVDIHCHGGNGYLSHHEPLKVMAYHRANGTGAMLQTLYRNLGIDGIYEGELKIEAAMEKDKGILGIHLEGPYLNPGLGSKAGNADMPDPKVYPKLFAGRQVKHCTFAPELDGACEFCRYIKSLGVAAAMGHSCASVEEVRAATEAGATIVTHLFDATGTSDKGMNIAGTKDLSFDDACMLQDGLYYEIINDKNGIHVRHDMIRLLEKTVGRDRIVGITDCFCAAPEGDEDVNFENGELTGSRMTMIGAARNFLKLGYPLHDVFNITSRNPAIAINMQDKVGSLEVGRYANVLAVSEDLSVFEWASVNI